MFVFIHPFRPKTRRSEKSLFFSRIFRLKHSTRFLMYLLKNKKKQNTELCLILKFLLDCYKQLFFSMYIVHTYVHKLCGSIKCTIL